MGRGATALGLTLVSALVGSARAETRSELGLALTAGNGTPVPWIDDEPRATMLALGLEGGRRIASAADHTTWLRASISTGTAFSGSLDGPGIGYTRVGVAFDRRRCSTAWMCHGWGASGALGRWSGDEDAGLLLDLGGDGFVHVGGEHVSLRAQLHVGVLAYAAGGYLSRLGLAATVTVGPAVRF